jgi:hypothetical protein
MNRRAFRSLIVLKWLLLLSMIAAYTWERRYLPPELSSYVHARESAAMNYGELAVFIAATVFLVLNLVVSIGLFRFSKWAKYLLLPCYVIPLLYMPFSGPGVEPGLAGALNYAGVLVDGAIPALVHYSPLSEVFNSSGGAV